MTEGIIKTLISEAEIAAITGRLAGEIAADYAGKRLLAVGILNGAFVFMSDLVRKIGLPLETAFIKASSYGDSSVSVGSLSILYDGVSDYSGRHVLLIDDILDTGTTLAALAGRISEKNPESLELCVLLDKPGRRRIGVSAKYVGKAIPDVFVAGYGLDYAGKYRNLPYIAVVDTGG